MAEYFIQQGGILKMTNELSVKVHPTLPVGVYDVLFDKQMGYYLQVKTDIKELPSKLYGTVEQRVARILHTYIDRANKGLPTGVLLSGEKGSGKTLLANVLMHKCGLPCLVVSSPFGDTEFLKLLTAGGRKLILFDEFEKVYKEGKDDDGDPIPGSQAGLLSMLDGYYAAQNLVVATLNDPWGVIDAMKNRPSRFFYHYQYVGLDEEFVREYCKDKLKRYSDAAFKELQQAIAPIKKLNFDMLQALVEEMNRFGDTATDALKHLNVGPEYNRGTKYAVALFKDDKPFPTTGRGKFVELAYEPEASDFWVYPNKAVNIYVNSDFYEGTDTEGNHLYKIEEDGIIWKVVLTPQYSYTRWSI